MEERIETTGELIEWLKKKDKTGKRRISVMSDTLHILKPRKDGGDWIVAECIIEG